MTASSRATAGSHHWRNDIDCRQQLSQCLAELVINQLSAWFLTLMLL